MLLVVTILSLSLNTVVLNPNPNKIAKFLVSTPLLLLADSTSTLPRSPGHRASAPLSAFISTSHSLLVSSLLSFSFLLCHFYFPVTRHCLLFWYRFLTFMDDSRFYFFSLRVFLRLSLCGLLISP